MSGVDARDGFWFQDARILIRLLRDALLRRVARLAGEQVAAPIRIRIEAAIEVDGAMQSSSRPLWDSVSVVGADSIVDETKLGDVSKEERLAFYARLRATVATRRSADHVVPRLTTASGAQTNEAKWRGLAQESATVPIPATAPESATTATTLAQEALFYLTSQQLPSRKRNNQGKLVDAPTPSMNEADARAILTRFVFDDELDRPGTEAELKRLLADLGDELLLDESIRQLRGWIAEKACVRPEGAEMTCETLGDELRVLARYLSVNVDSESLLKRLRAASPPRIDTRLEVRRWRDVQPAASKNFDAGHSRIMFIAAGGVGKSFALSQIHDEMAASTLCLWIDATSSFDLERLAEAAGFGTWIAKHKGQRLTVLIDGLDQTSNALGLLSTIHRSLAGSDALVISAARPTTWSSISAASHGWQGINLEQWATETVKALPFAATLPPDLVDLLRTPLLLDLYLRTVGDTDPETVQPTSRHELVSEYFARRILPSGAETSAARRTLVRRLGAEVAAGRPQWSLERDDAAIATQLVDQGLLVDAFGRHRFRHSLLQDVAVAMAMSSADPNACVVSLRDINSATLRHDASRSLIEAAIATGSRRELLDTPPLGDLVRSLQAAELPIVDPLGDVVVSHLDVPLVLGVGVDLAPILRWARSAGNRSWLHSLAKQPVSPRPQWLRAESLDEDLFQLARDVSHTKLPNGVARELALRLRSWAGQDLAPVGWGAASVIRAVIHHSPTRQTLEWLDSLSALPDSGTCDLLSGLRLIASQPGELDEEMLARLVLLGFDNVDLGSTNPRPRTGDQDEGTTRVIMDCLQAGDDIPGLFATRPRAAFRVLFELVARHGGARERERVERSSDPEQMKMMRELGRIIRKQARRDGLTLRASRGQLLRLCLLIGGIACVAFGLIFRSDRPNDPFLFGMILTGIALTTAALLWIVKNVIRDKGPESETGAGRPQHLEPGVVNDVPTIGWHPQTYPLHATWVSATYRLRDPVIMEIAKDEAGKSRSLAARNLVAGRDANVARNTEWVRHERPSWPDDPLPENTPEHLGRAWHTLVIIARVRSNGVRSTYVSAGTLRTVLASPDLLASAPPWALQSLHIVINDFAEHADQAELATWCERLLLWLERGPLDHERAVEALECFEDCFHGLQNRDEGFVSRFGKVFGRQLARSTQAAKAELFFAAHRMCWHPALADQLLSFCRTHPDRDALRPIWIAVAHTPTSTFLNIARELVSLSPHPLPSQTKTEIGLRLGAACCYPSNAVAWPMMKGWLADRPTSGTGSNSDAWRSLLDSVANGASHHATNDVARYVEVATGLWRAWVASPSEKVHGLAHLLFACITSAKGETRRSLVTALGALAAEVLAAGDAFDLLGLKEVPWSELSLSDLDAVVERLIARIEVGPPDPDEYRRVAAALDDLVESLGESNALGVTHAERLYAVVQPAAWMVNREARCQELQARARLLRSGA